MHFRMKREHHETAVCPECGQQFTKCRTWQKFDKAACRVRNFWKNHEIVKTAPKVVIDTGRRTNLGTTKSPQKQEKT